MNHPPKEKDWPVQDDLEHHALVDAVWNRDVYAQLQKRIDD